jgi:hypothetical protein
MEVAEYEAELWIGLPEWPEDCQYVSPHPNDPAVCTQFQIGGHFCFQQKFWGLKFHVPRDDPLAILGHSYLESELPGDRHEDYTTPLEEVIRLKNRLEHLGLDLDPVHYLKFAEAYIPINGASAWNYAISRELEIFSAPYARMHEKTRRLDFLGLGPSWTETMEYLKAFWESHGGRDWFLTKEPWTAALHYPNCD